jgi:hypothetical protein
MPLRGGETLAWRPPRRLAPQSCQVATTSPSPGSTDQRRLPPGVALPGAALAGIGDAAAALPRQTRLVLAHEAATHSC